jgi:peptide/nickel transport system permease protein
MTPTAKQHTWRRLWKTSTGSFALITLSVVVVSALVSLAWTPFDPSESNIQRAWQSPSLQHLLGTDGSGRDTLSRLMAGAQVTVMVALGAALFSSLIGLALAVTGALGRSWVREPVAVLIDVLIAFPTLLIAMMFAATFGGSVTVVVIAVGIGFGVSIGRVLRAEIRQVAQTDFVTAARASGVSRFTMLRRHILPNISSVFIVQISLVMGLSVLAEAGLSYLGFGAPPSMPSWGRMLAETQTFISVHPLSVLWPGLAITLTVLAFNVLGDALRDVLDPALTRRGLATRGTNTGVFNR